LTKFNLKRYNESTSQQKIHWMKVQVCIVPFCWHR